MASDSHASSSLPDRKSEAHRNVESHSVDMDGRGIRRRRTSDECPTVPGGHNHRENGVLFVHQPSTTSTTVPSCMDVHSCGSNPNMGKTTENSETRNYIANGNIWSRWKMDGGLTRRLVNMMNFFKSALVFHLPASIARFSLWRRRRVAAQCRTVIPNHLIPPPTSRHQQHPNRRYAGNKIKTTKYTMFTFLPKNLFEQFHRFANLYFVFVVLLNWIPQIEAFGRELAMIPVLFVLAVTAVKDIFEDRRRYLSDRKVNHSTCRVFNPHERRYVKTEWKEVIVGDFVHLSCNEIIPADILLVHSSDPMGLCYVETSNLDGESNLKQRHVIASLLDKGSTFSTMNFKSTIECEQPNNQLSKFSGFLLHADAQREVISKNNLLLRGCEIRNTDFIEGIVVYAGHDTKAMLNNSGPRYKRSKLERLMNWDIVWCVVLLLMMCFVGALGGGIWLSSFQDPFRVPYLAFIHNSGAMNPELEGFLVFWTFIIVLQVMIPISLYVNLEIVKLGQIFFITQDPAMYYAPAKKRVQCRALNIPEELGQIEYVMSDKTGTLTENQMIFRRCTVAGIDYAASNVAGSGDHAGAGSQLFKETAKDVRPNVQLQQILLAGCADRNGDDAQAGGDQGRRQSYFDFFINMAICNTVVVNAHPHSDRMNASGHISNEYDIDTPPFPVNVPGGSMGNGLHQPTTRSTPPPAGQTPVDFPSPRYTVKSKHGPKSPRTELPSVVTTDHCATERSGDQYGDDHGIGSDQCSDQVGTELAGGERLSVSENESGKSRPTTLQLGKKLLQLPMLAVGRLPPMVGRKSTTPSVSPGHRNPVYEAESPDELALVYAAAAYGFRLVKRQLCWLTIELPNGELTKYETLHVLPFDSIRKRMSVIVRHPKTRKIQLFCKGADSVIMELLSDRFSKSQRGQTYIYKSQEYLNLYASYGLRTMCLAKRDLDPDEYEKWAAVNEDAELSLDDDREQLIFRSALIIEKDMDLLGVTGVEDRLQDGVPDSIAALRNAGMKVWVLTGDKIETAVNIAYACKLFIYGMELIQLSTRNEDDAETLLDHHLERLLRRGSNRASINSMALVVDGQTLTFFLTPRLEAKFVQLISKCTSVLCCRTTPLQKASVVRLVKGKLGGTTLAIGDGANDVSMIQCADVGVGLSGQEGMQAVMASDFAMPQFRFIQRLLLVHGHWCYDRLARMVLYFFYKNAMFVFTLFWFQFFNGFTAQVMIDPLYLMLHNLIFTSLPPLLLGIMDQDVPSEVLIEQYLLYRQGPKGLLYRTHSFWLNMLDSLWQSLVCFFFPYFMYSNSTTSLWSFGFVIESAVQFCNHGHLLLVQQAWTFLAIASVIFSLFIFYAFALVYNAFVFNCCVPDGPHFVAEWMVIDVQYWLGLLLILVAALFPRFCCQTMMNTFFPSDILKARARYRMRSKKVTVDKQAKWLVKFTNKTKSVSFLPTTRRTSTRTSNPENVDNAAAAVGHRPRSSGSDTVEEMRV